MHGMRQVDAPIPARLPTRGFRPLKRTLKKMAAHTDDRFQLGCTVAIVKLLDFEYELEAMKTGGGRIVTLLQIL